MNYNDIQNIFGTPLNQAKATSTGIIVSVFIFGVLAGVGLTYCFLQSKMEQTIRNSSDSL